MSFKVTRSTRNSINEKVKTNQGQFPSQNVSTREILVRGSDPNDTFKRDTVRVVSKGSPAERERIIEQLE